MQMHAIRGILVCGDIIKERYEFPCSPVLLSIDPLGGMVLFHKLFVGVKHAHVCGQGHLGVHRYHGNSDGFPCSPDAAVH